MAVIWVVCGAGRGVGKTWLAQQLCAVLPDAVYAKQGCGARRPNGPANFFQTEEQVAAFVKCSRSAHQHVVLESNEWARAGKGDIIIFIDAAGDRTDQRSDVEMLRAGSHLQVSGSASSDAWRRFLDDRLADHSLPETVCEILRRQQRHLFPR